MGRKPEKTRKVRLKMMMTICSKKLRNSLGGGKKKKKEERQIVQRVGARVATGIFF